METPVGLEHDDGVHRGVLDGVCLERHELPKVRLEVEGDLGMVASAVEKLLHAVESFPEVARHSGCEFDLGPAADGIVT